MVCIYCDAKTSVTNSRKRARDKSVWRRHKCTSCSATFTSVEQVDWPQAVLFKANGSHTEPFSRDKLLISVHHSLQHRKDATEASTELTNTILSRLVHNIVDASISRATVITVTTEVIKRFDKAAAATYAAYHPL